MIVLSKKDDGVGQVNSGNRNVGAYGGKVRIVRRTNYVGCRMDKGRTDTGLRQ